MYGAYVVNYKQDLILENLHSFIYFYCFFARMLCYHSNRHCAESLTSGIVQNPGLGLLSLGIYSLSDLVGLTAFSSFFPQKVCFCLPNLANLLIAQPRVCIMYKHTFCLNSAKCWFCSLGPIVKFAHWQQWRSPVSLLLAMGKFYNGT